MIDVTQEDFRLKGYHKVMTENANGDAYIIEYFADYNGGTPQRLKVRETRSYTRNAVTGIVETINVNIEWLSGDGVTVRATKNFDKHLDVYRGMAKNEKARVRLLNKAKGAAIQLIGLEAGKTFMRDFSNEMTLYVAGDRIPLIDGINASAQSQTFKDTLVGILDVSYISV